MPRPTEATVRAAFGPPVALPSHSADAVGDQADADWAVREHRRVVVQRLLRRGLSREALRQILPDWTALDDAPHGRDGRDHVESPDGPTAVGPAALTQPCSPHLGSGPPDS